MSYNADLCSLLKSRVLLLHLFRIFFDMVRLYLKSYFLYLGEQK